MEAGTPLGRDRWHHFFALGWAGELMSVGFHRRPTRRLNYGITLHIDRRRGAC